MSNTDALDEPRARIAEQLSAGTTIFAIGETRATCIDTTGKLFRDFAGTKENMVVAITSAGIVLTASSFDGGFGAGTLHYGTDAIPWGAIQSLIEPTALIQGARKGLNIVLDGGGLVQTVCFPGKPGDAQTHFHDQGAAIAIQAWSQARAAGAPRAEPVLLARSTIASEPTVIDFVRFIATPRLRPGETIEVFGAVTTPDVDALLAEATPATAPAALFAIGTTQRLLLVRTSLSPLGTPLCENRGAASIELAQIHWQPEVAQICRGGTPYVRFMLDTGTQVTLDFVTPRPDVPNDAGFRQGFSQWLVSRTSSTSPPPAAGAGPTRRPAEIWPTPVDAKRVAIIYTAHHTRAIAAGTSSPVLAIVMLVIAGLAGLGAAFEAYSFLHVVVSAGIPMPTTALCGLVWAAIAIGLGLGGWSRLEKQRAAKQRLEGGVAVSGVVGGIPNRRALLGALAVLGCLSGLCCVVSIGARLLGGGETPETYIGMAGVGALAVQARVCTGGALEGAGPVTSNPTLMVLIGAPGATPAPRPDLSQPVPFSVATLTYAVCMTGPTMEPVPEPRPGCTERSRWDVSVVRAATGAVVARGVMRERPNASCGSAEREGEFDGTPSATDIHTWVLAQTGGR